MKEDDPFEALTRINPVRRDPDSVEAPEAREAFTRIVSQRRRRLRRPNAQRLRLLAPAALAGAVAIVVVAVFAFPQSSPRPQAVRCYSEPTLTAGFVVVRDGRHPIATCLGLWRRGVIGNASPHLGLSTTRLAACALSGRTVGVFPIRKEPPCRALGLPTYHP